MKNELKSKGLAITIIFMLIFAGVIPIINGKNLVKGLDNHVSSNESMEKSQTHFETIDSVKTTSASSEEKLSEKTEIITQFNINKDKGLMRVTFQSNPYSITTKSDGESLIEMENFGFILEPFHPMLPSKSFLLGLPPGATELSIKVLNSKKENIPGNFLIQAAPPFSNGNENNKIGGIIQPNMKSDIYSSTEQYPNSAFKYLGLGQMRKYYFTKIRFCPILYEPANGDLTLIKELTLEIEFNITENFSSELLLDTTMDSFASEIIDNYQSIQSFYTPQTTEGKNRDSNWQSYDYVIITTDTLTDAVSPIIGWKQSQGYTVKIITISWILSNYQGQDLPERIRNFLIDKYSEWNTEYVLFVGSIASIPMRYCYPNSEDHTYDVPTDYYYADLTGDWDSDGDGYYGERDEDNIDFYPEIYVGRIPFDDQTNVQNICQKTVDFDQDDGTWKKKALLLGPMSNYDDDPVSGYDRTDNAELMEECWNDFLNSCGFSKTTMYEKTGSDPSTYSCDYPLNNVNLLNYWPYGYGIVNFEGHGYKDHWSRKIWNDNGDGVPEDAEMSWPILFDSYDCPTLNDNKPSIVFSGSCDNAYPEESTSLIRSLLENGAVECIATTRLGWYTVGWLDENYGGSASIDYYFFKYLVQQKQNCGNALYNSKIYYINNFDWWDWQIYENMYGFCLFGDPSTGIENQLRVHISSDKNQYTPAEMIDLKVNIYNMDDNVIFPLQKKDFEVYIDNQEVNFFNFDNTIPSSISLQIEADSTISFHDIKVVVVVDYFITSISYESNTISVETIPKYDVIPSFTDSWIFLDPGSKTNIQKCDGIYYSPINNNIQVKYDYSLNKANRKDTLTYSIIEFNYINNEYSLLSSGTREVKSNSNKKISGILDTFQSIAHRKYLVTVHSGLGDLHLMEYLPFVTLFSGNIYTSFDSQNRLLFTKFETETDTKPDLLIFTAPTFAQKYIKNTDQFDQKTIDDYKKSIITPAMVKLSTDANSDINTKLIIMQETDESTIIRKTQSIISAIKPDAVSIVGPYPSKNIQFQGINSKKEYDNPYGTVSRMGYSHVMIGFKNAISTSIEYSKDDEIRGTEYYVPYENKAQFGTPMENEIPDDETPYLKISPDGYPSLTFSAAYSPKTDGASIFTLAPIHQQYDPAIEFDIIDIIIDILTAGAGHGTLTRVVNVPVTISTRYSSIELPIIVLTLKTEAIYTKGWFVKGDFTVPFFDANLFNHKIMQFDLTEGFVDLVQSSGQRRQDVKNYIYNWGIDFGPLKIDKHCWKFKLLGYTLAKPCVGPWTVIPKVHFKLKDIDIDIDKDQYCLPRAKIPKLCVPYTDACVGPWSSPKYCVPPVDIKVSGSDIANGVYLCYKTIDEVLIFLIQVGLGFTKSAEYLEQAIQSIPLISGGSKVALLGLEPGSVHTLIRESTDTVASGIYDTVPEAVKNSKISYKSTSGAITFAIDTINTIITAGCELADTPIKVSIDSEAELLKYTTTTDDINVHILSEDLNLLRNPEKMSTYLGEKPAINHFISTYEDSLYTIGDIIGDDDFEKTNNVLNALGDNLEKLEGVSPKYLYTVETLAHIEIYECTSQTLILISQNIEDNTLNIKANYRIRETYTKIDVLEVKKIKIENYIKKAVTALKTLIKIVQGVMQLIENQQLIDFNSKQLFYIGPPELPCEPYDDPSNNLLHPYPNHVNFNFSSHPEIYDFGNYSNQSVVAMNVTHVNITSSIPSNQTTISTTSYSYSPNDPLMPALSLIFKAPANQTVNNISFDLNDIENIAPINLSKSKITVKNTTLPGILAKNGTYPTIQYSYHETQTENTTFVSVNIVPLEYNASNSSLKYWHNVSMNLTFKQRDMENTTLLEFEAYPNILSLGENTTTNFSIHPFNRFFSNSNLSNITIKIIIPDELAVSDCTNGTFYSSNNTIIWKIPSLSTDNPNHFNKYVDMKLTSPIHIPHTTSKIVNITARYDKQSYSLSSLKSQTANFSIPVFLVKDDVIDIELTNIAVSPDLITNSSQPVQIFIKNNGTYDVTNIPVRLTLDDKIINEVSIPKISQGEEKNFTMQVIPHKEGILNLSVAALQSSSETNLKNNIKSLIVTVEAPCPCLNASKIKNQTEMKSISVLFNGCFMNVSYPHQMKINETKNLTINITNRANSSINNTYINISSPSEITTIHATNYFIDKLPVNESIEFNTTFFALDPGYGILNISIESSNKSYFIIKGIIINYFAILPKINYQDENIANISINITNNNLEISYYNLSLGCYINYSHIEDAIFKPIAFMNAGQESSFFYNLDISNMSYGQHQFHFIIVKNYEIIYQREIEFIKTKLPFANFSFEPKHPITADLIFFNSTSTDSDGIIANWTWDFGDGNKSYGENQTYVYYTPGTYRVTLTVEDNATAKSSVSRNITIVEEKHDVGVKNILEPSNIADEEQIWLHYDNGNNFDGMGITEGGVIESAIRLTQTELMQYDGSKISKIKFYHYENGTHSGMVNIYHQGSSNSPGPLITSEPFSVSGKDWQVISLTNPFYVDITQDLWVSVEVTHLSNQRPIGIDNGPAVDAKGDWLRINDEGAWTELQGYGTDANWNIQILLNETNATKILNPGIHPVQTLIKNYGSYNETFNISAKIFQMTDTLDSLFYESKSSIVQLQPTAEKQICFENVTFESEDQGSYRLEVRTILDIDQNINNDLKVLYFILTNPCMNISMKTGWNLLTIPLQSSWYASDIAVNVSGCLSVSRWDSVNQTYKTFIVGGPSSFDFPIESGYGYFVDMTQSDNLSMCGPAITNASISLEIGWNLLGWYHEQNTTASNIAENITGCLSVSCWDAVAQTYKTYIVGGPDAFDFVVTQGTGLFVDVIQESIWNGEG